MDRKKLFLILQSALCIALAVALAAAVVGVYREGAAAKAADPLANIFTRERLAARLRPAAALFCVTAGLAAVGLILDIKDEKGLKPVKGGGRTENKAPGGRALRTALLIAAVVLIAAGVFNGSARDVFGKAVRICTECIGLG